MPSFALTAAGLSTQTLEEITDEFAAKLRAQFGDNLELSTSSIMGQLLNIIAEKHAESQQVALACYASLRPDSAEGVPLDEICALTSTERLGALQSTAPCLFTGTPGTNITDGKQVRLNATNSVWEVYGGPYVIGGGGTIAGTVRSVDTGEIAALTTGPSGWTIVTPVAGWSSFETTADATLGRDEESNKLLRKRRITEIQGAAQGPLGAIKANVSQVVGVQKVRVYHNPATNPVDADGIPFKAFNVLVETQPATPGSALIASIAEAIWTGCGAGGQAYGTDVTTTVTDSEGGVQPIAFDLLDITNLYVRVTLTTSTSEEPQIPNLTTVVAADLLTALQDNHEEIGADALPWKITGEIYDMNLTGVDGVLVEISDDGVLWVTTKISVGIRARADWDSARITVLEA